jgi:hypothetical protein
VSATGTLVYRPDDYHFDQKTGISKYAPLVVVTNWLSLIDPD